MLDVLTAKQLTEWEAYLSIDPIENKKQDYRMAYMSSLITNLVIRAMGSKGAKLTSVQDFKVEWDVAKGNKEEQTPEQMKNLFIGLAPSTVTDFSVIERNEEGIRITPPKTKI